MQQMKKALEKKEDKPAEPEKAAKDGERHSKPGERYTENELMVRLKFIIGCCLAFTLIGIVFTVLYSIMFVTQPLNAISPIDQKFFELIIPIATFLTGTLSGIMLAGKDDKEAKLKALEAATRPSSPSPGGSLTPGTLPKPITPMGGPSLSRGMAAGALMGAAASLSAAPMMPSQSIDDLGLAPGQSPKMTDEG